MDYCIVPYENLSMIEEFRVVTMAESIDEMNLRGEPLRVPDHSLLLWEVVMEDARLWEDVESKQGRNQKVMGGTYEVPEGFLEEDRHTAQDLLQRIRRLDGGQEELDDIYKEMADVMKAGLVQVRKEERGGHREQPWFTKKIAVQRRCFHKAEADCMVEV